MGIYDNYNYKRIALVMIAISTAVLFAAIPITGFSILVFAYQQQQDQQQLQPLQKFISQQSASSTDPIMNQSSSTASSLPDVFTRVENSVVQITSSRTNPNEIIIINGVPATGRSTALGSGFVYDNQGHIVTNYHVVTGVKKADVTFTDGNTYSANVVGKDAYSDLTILQITGNFSEEKVIPLPLANSSTVRPGEQVIAIGNPFGLSGTITTGIVSAKGRLLPNPDTGFPISNTIQTDAAINPGNSGGPLLNAKGQVIGMNSAIFSSTGSYSGVGFAIPSNTIAKEVPIIIKNGTYIHPWIGISGGKISPELARSAGLPANYKGVIVGTIQPGSPADKAGLKGLAQDDSGATKIGDIITAVDGHATRQIDDIINYIESQKSVGDNIKLTVNRNGQIMGLTATLQARPNSISQTQQQQQQQQPGLGPIPELPQIPGFPRLPPLLPPLLP